MELAGKSVSPQGGQPTTVWEDLAGNVVDNPSQVDIVRGNVRKREASIGPKIITRDFSSGISAKTGRKIKPNPVRPIGRTAAGRLDTPRVKPETEGMTATTQPPRVLGELSATITNGPKGRTTTVTLPDGTTASRTSKTRDYTHAVVVTEDNHAHAAEVRKGVARRQAFVDALERWVAEGADTSKLKTYPSGSRSYAEERAGVSPNEYYLPGFEPVKERVTARGYGTRSYWRDAWQFSLPNFEDQRREVFSTDTHPGIYRTAAERRDLSGGLTRWERWGPEYVLGLQRETIERETTQANKLEAAPQYDYSVWRWSASADNAQSYANQVDAIKPWRTTRVVGVEGATGRKAEGEGTGAVEFDPADAARQVREMTPEQAQTYVNGLRAPQVRKLADQLGALGANRAQLDYLKQRIVSKAGGEGGQVRAHIDATLKLLDGTMAAMAATGLRGIRERAALPETSVDDTIAEIRILARESPTDIKQALLKLIRQLQLTG